MERAEQLAQFFHQTYERLAPEFGYETRRESAVPWHEVPEQNRHLMIAVCQEIIDRENEAEEEETIVQVIQEERRADLSEGLDMETFHGWLLTKVSQGWPEALLLKQAAISINCLMDAAHRWERLEGGHSASAPIWLDTNERNAILAALRGTKGTTIRVLRQALQAMLP